ncbi:sugar ABC transporter substrate-binding protein [Lentibacillus sp. N15]|uniref:ABC transporter substrate-binding protein n=1 Tax=Lentibacillus songyuanensis TaxID=3136161 RepID=UPI0031BB802F
MKKKHALIVMLLSFVLVLFTACIDSSKDSESKDNGGSDGDKGETIEFWTMQLKPDFTDFIEGMIADFEEENPNIKVDWLDVPASDLKDKMISAVSAGTAPDLVNLPVGFSHKLVEMDALVNMNDALTDDQKNQYIEGAWKAYTTEDGETTFGIPWYLTMDVTMYNTEILKEAGLDADNPPETFDEAADMGKTIKDKTGKYGLYPSLDLSMPLQYMTMFNGSIINDEGTKASFNTPEGLHMFEYFTKLYQDEIIPHSLITDDQRKGIDIYASGEAAIFNEGMQFLTQVKANAPDVYENTKVSPALLSDAGKIGLTTQGLVIPETSEHQDAAVKLAMFITNAKNTVDFAKETPVFPPVTEALDDPYFSELPDDPEPIDEARLVGAEQLGHAESLVNTHGNQEKVDDLQQAFYDALQKAMLGEKSPKDALEEAESAFNEILAE